jgi:hypothetical protein
VLSATHFPTHRLFSIIFPYRTGSHLFPSVPFRDTIQLIHELPSTLQPRTRGHLTVLASMRYVLMRRSDGLEGLGGLYGLLHRISMLYTSSLIFPSPSFPLGPASVKHGSDVATLSARAGDRHV